jgi:hypothetical protein
MITLTIARWLIALILYGAVIALIVHFKPAMMFDAEGKVKKWGVCTDGGYSVLSPQILFPLIAILCYFVVVLIELIYI